jgi:Ser-tRNA(Ala) deacylase AlaX
MTRKVFWNDPYLASLDTRVAAVRGSEVLLEETIFYALSGGQESDHGSIGGLPVRAARKEGMEIVYTLDEGHGLAAGQPVRVEIDWARRYRLMRLHFAAELVLELAYRRLPGVEKTGAHIAQDKARIDFVWPQNIAPLFPALLEEVNGIIASDRPIVSAYSDEAAQRRYWQIEGLAQVPCGGTHLKRTGEVGTVSLKRRNPGKGRERVEIFVDEPSG